MSKQYTFVIAFFLGIVSSQAATLVVNNASPSPGQYSTVAAAIAAASNGDIILIQASLTSYGSVTVNKSVTLRGGGWNAAYKQLTYETTLGNITLSAALSNVNIQGITFDVLGLTANGSGDYEQSNILIEFCKVTNQVSFRRKCHDWIIRNNLFNSTSTNISTDGVGSLTSNIIIEYNIFRGYLAYFDQTANILINHNLFISAAGSTQIAFAQAASGLLVTNNIFSNTSPTSNVSLTNSSFNNNIYVRTAGLLLPSGNGVTVTLIDNPTNKVLEFENYNNTAFSVDHNYRLKATSLGKGTGTDGKDVGIYTDTNTFSLTGEPDIPAVRTLLILNSVVPSGGTLNINMTASKARRDKN